jgi:hypothetical protein
MTGSKASSTMGSGRGANPAPRWDRGRAASTPPALPLGGNRAYLWSSRPPLVPASLRSPALPRGVSHDQSSRHSRPSHRHRPPHHRLVRRAVRRRPRRRASFPQHRRPGDPGRDRGGLHLFGNRAPGAVTLTHRRRYFPRSREPFRRSTIRPSRSRSSAGRRSAAPTLANSSTRVNGLARNGTARFSSPCRARISAGWADI